VLETEYQLNEPEVSQVRLVVIPTSIIATVFTQFVDYSFAEKQG